MKKLIIIALAIIPLSLFADSWNISFTTSSTPVFPRYVTNGRAWTTGTAYSANTYVKAGTRMFWTYNGGTSTVEPSVTKTESDGVSWVLIPNKPWTEVLIKISTSDTVYLNIDAAAVNGTGYYLDGAGSRVHLPANKEIFAAGTASGTLGVTVY